MSKYRVTWTLLLWIPGSALFGIGWVLDSNGWTAENGFTSNILAAAASGFLGLPIAAIVVQSILRQDAESRRRRETIQSARKNFADMQASLETFGINKIRRIQAPVAAAAMEVALLKLAAQSSRTAPAELIRQVRSSLSSLNPIISENLPSNVEDEWRFSSALRRWDILNEIVFSSAEVDGLRVISDEDYATLSGSIDLVSSKQVERLPDLMRDIDSLLTALRQSDDDSIQLISPRVRPYINKIDETLSSLDTQLAARVDLYIGLVAARKIAENMPTD